MLLDFRDEASVNPDIEGELGEIAEDIREPFNAFIERLLVANGHHRVFWFTRAMCRNNQISPLYMRLCRLVLLQQLLNRGQTVEVVQVDSPGLAAVLRAYVAEHKLDIRIDRVGRRRGGWHMLLPLLSLAKSLYFLAVCILCAARGRPRPAAPAPFSAITLLDGFVTPGSIDRDGEYVERYYPGLREHLTEEERSHTWNYPTLLNFRRPQEYKAAFHIMRRSDTPFLVREDYLRATDYVYAIWASWRLLLPRLDDASFFGFGIGPLIREDLWWDLWSKTIVEALLKYRLPRRLKDRGIELRLVVEWFENQVIDRASIMGFKEAYPDTPIVGYQGYIHPRHYLSLYPTSFEHRAGTLPHVVAVIGQALMDTPREHCPELRVIRSPAFRYSDVWRDEAAVTGRGPPPVLVALPNAVAETARLLNMVLLVDQHLGDEPVEFWIKPHPSHDLERLKARFTESWPPTMRFIEGALADWVDLASMLVSNISTTSVEAMARGLPVVMVPDRAGLIWNPVPEDLAEDILRVCKTPVELAETVRAYIHANKADRQRHARIGTRVRRLYFEPVNRRSVRMFLRLPV